MSLSTLELRSEASILLSLTPPPPQCNQQSGNNLKSKYSLKKHNLRHFYRKALSPISLAFRASIGKGLSGERKNRTPMYVGAKTMMTLGKS